MVDSRRLAQHASFDQIWYFYTLLAVVAPSSIIIFCIWVCFLFVPKPSHRLADAGRHSTICSIRTAQTLFDIDSQSTRTRSIFRVRSTSVSSIYLQTFLILCLVCGYIYVYVSLTFAFLPYITNMFSAVDIVYKHRKCLLNNYLLFSQRNFLNDHRLILHIYKRSIHAVTWLQRQNGC